MQSKEESNLLPFMPYSSTIISNIKADLIYFSMSVLKEKIISRQQSVPNKINQPIRHYLDDLRTMNISVDFSKRHPRNKSRQQLILRIISDFQLYLEFIIHLIRRS